VRNPFHRKRRLLVAATVTLALAGGGAAYAYFTSTGQGYGTGTVGSPANWTVQDTSHSFGSAGALYPCGTLASPCPADEETIVFTVTNNDSGAQELQTAVPGIASDGSGNVVTGGTDTATGITGGTSVTGCEASWFSAADSPAFTTVDVAGNATTTVTVVVAMEDSGTLQNPCIGAAPDVTLNVT
jgi:hypothetical protein